MVESAQFSNHLYHPKYWLLWLGVGLMRALSLLPLHWQMSLGKGLGRLVRVLAGSRSNTARRNLELCFPDMSDAERDTLFKRNFEETGKAVFDTICAWWWSDERVQQHMHIKGTEYVEQTIAGGQGVILFAVHCLPLEMGARIFGQFQPGVGVYRPHNNAVMEYLQVNGRLRSNKGLVPKRDLRQMVRCLRNADVIWYTADQDFGRSSAVFIPLFAVPDAATITGATTLAKLGKARVLPFFVERDADDKGYSIEIMPPLEDFPGEDETADAIRGNQVVESLISRNLPQYMWLHRRFKTRPDPDAPSLYK
ncbi:LpxL/LpxP family Kdo(2)-lipid IV(A) lauroyl/palmitoleoyl acyltransferase [Shewanella litorisediminis]|uniref:Lipid A biosynthesis acyltransferase n=1 Tax=Shewanella litorisediminis TaxID=1173586 RepID=A0ABX7G570_9GAMM|nr:LpxL/LpxP family Kdo(2)-lipid IV(A) lauroyl/palmitoleoyl acyltransferase [Shewanella litorisediminis]MCL2918045.1 LpxL/LpxP family Kdo(2)-lipid IV(A) lauroyl/palmitoleoyl acyltransferase [Shewanella litorisediminis]QRH02475.1 LpxL/LpxP family Kdo(2)-lipid IV(A) lauroyl/palmitoleoyl acyltransferase [Shewanella litorisediminis]